MSKLFEDLKFIEKIISQGVVDIQEAATYDTIKAQIQLLLSHYFWEVQHPNEEKSIYQVVVQAIARGKLHRIHHEYQQKNGLVGRIAAIQDVSEYVIEALVDAGLINIDKLDKNDAYREKSKWISNAPLSPPLVFDGNIFKGPKQAIDEFYGKKTITEKIPMMDAPRKFDVSPNYDLDDPFAELIITEKDAPEWDLCKTIVSYEHVDKKSTIELIDSSEDDGYLDTEHAAIIVALCRCGIATESAALRHQIKRLANSFSESFMKENVNLSKKLYKMLEETENGLQKTWTDKMVHSTKIKYGFINEGLFPLLDEEETKRFDKILEEPLEKVDEGTKRTTKIARDIIED